MTVPMLVHKIRTSVTYHKVPSSCRYVREPMNRLFKIPSLEICKALVFAELFPGSVSLEVTLKAFTQPPNRLIRREKMEHGIDSH